MYVLLPSMVNFKFYIYAWTMQIKEPYRSFIPVYKIWAPSLMILAIYLQFIISAPFSYKYVNTKIHLSIYYLNFICQINVIQRLETKPELTRPNNNGDVISLFSNLTIVIDKYVMMHRLTLITSYCETSFCGLLCKICKQWQYVFLLLLDLGKHGPQK